MPAPVYGDLKEALAGEDHVFKEAPVTIGVVDAMRLVARASVPDMPDRIVSATAVHLGVPVINRVMADPGCAARYNLVSPAPSGPTCSLRG